MKKKCYVAAAALVAGLVTSGSAVAKTIDYRASIDVRPVQGSGWKAKKPKGFVFNDTNRDGIRQLNEPGIPGVMVSNGRDVVMTNLHGWYILPEVSEADEAAGISIFITEPAGYDVPVNEDNIPQFFYHHLPAGSPLNVRGEKFRFGGMEPTGPLPGIINFPLVKVRKKNNFKIAVSGDTQPYSNNEVGYVRDTLSNELAQRDDIEALIIEGDVIGDSLNLFPRFKSVLSAAETPQYYVPGNHDADYDSPNDNHSFDTFKREWGPAYYSFDIGEVHFVVLDDVSYPCTPDQNNDDLHSFCMDPKTSPTYNGFITEQQMEWLEKDLAHVPADKLVVLNMHIPPQVFIDMGASKHQVDNILEVYDLLGYGSSGNPRRPALALSGHSHTLEHIRPGEVYAGWETALGDRSPGSPPFPQIVTGASCGSWWSADFDDNGIPVSYQRLGAPRGYQIFEFDGNTYKDTFKATGKSVDRQMSISMLTPSFNEWADTLIAWTRTPKAERSDVPPVNVNDLPDYKIVTAAELGDTVLTVNAWNGSIDSKVTMQIDERAPVEMTRTQDGYGEGIQEGIDPYALRTQLYSYRYAAVSESGDERTQGFELWNAAHFGPDAPQPLDEWMLTLQSIHLWQAPLPAALSEGTHTVKVKAVEHNGKVWEDTMVFEVRAERPAPFFQTEIWQDKP